VEEGGFVVAHNDPGIRAANEVTPISGFDPDPAWIGGGLLRGRVWVRNAI
jgi:hypothetical protein